MASTTLDMDCTHARQEALADLGEIASRMAHEIRNPLNAMRMQVAVIRNKLSQPDPQSLDVARTQLERLEHEVVRVEKLARAFLEFGRPPADEPQDVWLAPFLQDVVALVEPEFEEFGHSLTLEIGEKASNLWVRMDPAKLRQVVLNLLANARHAMNTAGRASVQLAPFDEGLVCIRVCDSGRGIGQEELPNIFQPFYTRGTGGEGLGLPIVKQIVEAVGGSLQVESKPEKGSCFTVILPSYAPVGD